jgi:Na+/melibiose symporter-like transporter
VKSESAGNASLKSRGFGSWDYLKITILGFGLTGLWQSMHTIILPRRLLDFVAESQKHTYLTLLSIPGQLLAMVVQPIVGAISDRSGFRWGRRRPFILMGVMLLILFLPGIGLAGSFAILFATYCLLQISSNTAQGPFQGFIPDLVPEEKRGLASGVKTLLEIIGGAIAVLIIGIFMGRYSADEESFWLWLSFGIPGIVLLVVMVVTMLTVKERPGVGGPRLPLLPALYKSFKIDVKANRDFIWFLISRLFVFMAFATIQQRAQYFLRDVIGVANPEEATGRFVAISVVCMLAVVYPAGRLSDRIGRKPIAVSSALLGALGILVIILSQSYGSILVAGGIIGIAVGAFMSTNWALATDLVAKGEEARYLGLANMATAGAAVLAHIIGPVIDYFEAISTDLGYQIMLVVCFVYFVIGALLLLKVKSPVSR